MQELENALRRSSAQGVIFGQTVANTVGISGSDLECLDFLNLEGRVTAGRLAEVTGLTTGAITGVVDRLEKAGLVRRERDPEDRRKVFIATVPENIAKVGRFYEHMQRGMEKLWESYSDAELRLAVGVCFEGLRDGAGSDRGTEVDGRGAQGKAREEGQAQAGLTSGPRKPSRAP